MATRSGDIDPTVPLYLQQHCGLSAADVDKLLNKQSGFQGLCGMTDLRAITSAGTPEAQMALDVRLTAYSSPYFAALNFKPVITAQILKPFSALQ
jgi:acetate kinase